MAYNYNGNTLFSGSLGNDDLSNFGNNVTIDGAGGTDTFWNSGARVTFIGRDGDDYIKNTGGEYATIFAGAGNDLISNSGNYSLIYGEDGNDSIDNSSIGDHSTIAGGKGDDLLKIYDYNDNNVIQYSEGDGNDVVINTGISGHFDATLSILKGNYSQVIDGKDLLVKVGDGSIRFKDMANTKVNIEGNVAENTPVTIIEPTTTAVAQTTATASSTTVTTASTTTAVAQTTAPSSTSTVTSDSSGGITNIYNFNGNNGTVIIDSSVEGGVTNTTTIDNSTNIVISGNTWTYSGGNKLIDNYKEGEIVALTSDYQGIDLKGSSFLVNSSSGQLEIQSSRDKFIGYSGGDENVVAYSYVASGKGNIDGRRKNGAVEIMIGADNADNKIYANDNGSSLWGGNGGNDSLVGGAGYDEFFYAIGSGNDVITNAGSNDIVNLLGVSLSQISYAEVSYSDINIGFTDGGKLQLQGQASTGFRLEGVTYTANRSTGGWSIK